MSAGILARDEDGREHRLIVVDHPSQMVTVFDAEMKRVMHPAAAVELAVALIQATRGHFKGIVGPVSGAF